MKALKLIDDIHIIDLNYNAVFLIEGSDSSVIIETAYPSEFKTIKRGFMKLNKKIDEFDYIIGTHIHLDHFGAVGHFLRENPELKVIIHPKGKKHLIDPSKLNESAKKAMGSRYSMVGQMLPVNPKNILDINDSAIINLGNFDLKLIFTPGHAKHHMVIYIDKLKLVFTGDALANTIKGYPIITVTPPPNYNYESAIESIEKIKLLHPEYLVQTHGGLISISDNSNIFNIVKNQHKKWLEFVKELNEINDNPNQNQVIEFFKKRNPLNLSEDHITMIFQKYHHVIFMNYMGIKRYLIKHPEI